MAKVTIILLLLFQQSQSEITSVPLPRNLQCPSSQIFDYAGLTCFPCESTSSCGCSPNSLQTNVDCSVESLWQGNCVDISCSPEECGLSDQVASLSKQSCVSCSTEQSIVSESSQYDATSNQCTCNNPAKGPSTGSPVATKKLVEVYNGAGLPIRMDCLTCPEGTAVIGDNLYEDGHQFFVSAGRKYIADPYTCASCPDPLNMFFDTDFSCVCAEGYLLTGEESKGQTCIKNSPSISSGYSRVRFQDPTFLGTESFDFNLDSITFSHLYLKAASECEYFKGTSGNSLRSCQALANLCVMSMYDEDAPACKQFEAISQRRVETYHNQEDWKYTLPWLYYRDEADYIENDKGINMKVSFHAKANHVNILSFKLAKFTVNGTFVGIEDLTNQFDSEACSDDSIQSDCLYPVPVFNRNLVRDNKFPNVNQQLDDDLDDTYTRRFFLFDNQSGRTSAGLDAMRYAKKVVLQIPTQSENPSKLYPPKLILEYATTTSGSWTGEEGIILLSKVEYSHKTENFWASIQIMIGFILAFAVVIFGVRMNSWQSRQRTYSAEGPSAAGSILGLHFMLHGFMIACHTFVMLFFSFTFMICLYWFVFFKLQNEVFLLLPSESEFHGVTNEYYFFDVSFRLLFWCQTICVAFKIVQQCRSDIIFVDWERPKRGKTSSSVPMWRLATVANEFNRMQSKRRSSIEFSLILMAFFMLGLGQHKNALPQPNFYYNQQGKENIALAFANAVLFWLISWTFQWLWRFVIYERYINEPPTTKFVDLCTVCNISVFVLLENNKGYYLHCKSPYATSDCSMEELLDNLKREGAGHMIERGLDGATCGCQTFDFFASPLFRHQISKIYSYAMPGQHRHSSQRPNNDQREGNEISLARAELTLFLQSFIDKQPIPSRDGLRYIVREPWLAERLLSVTPAEFRGNADSCSLSTFLQSTQEGFLTATLLGIEVDLFLHDVLTYNAANLAFGHAGISIFCTYIMHQCRTFLRSWYGKKNLSSKSLIDAKFLGS
ncbi:hypothetical protein ACHAXR_010500 [Thalassiosira sp. AJA248-18]